jgi:predicted RNA methylase
MAAGHSRAGFTVTATDLSDGVNFLDDKAWSQAVSHCDAIVTNPPYGLQGKLAERFIERALDLTRPQRAVAMLLKVDFDSGLTRRRFFTDCPAWMIKLVLLGALSARPQEQRGDIYRGAGVTGGAAHVLPAPR